MYEGKPKTRLKTINPVVGVITPQNIENFWSKVDFGDVDECWIWKGSNRRSKSSAPCYGSVNIWRRPYAAHRVSYMIANGEEFRHSKLDVRHLCNNSLCVNPFHLKEGTRNDNEQDKTDAGRRPVGENHPAAKLTNDQVKEIRHLYATGLYSQGQLGGMFGVSSTQINAVVNNREWFDENYIPTGFDIRRVRGRRTTPKVLKALELIKYGMRVYQAAAEAGCSPVAVYTAIKNQKTFNKEN